MFRQIYTYRAATEANLKTVVIQRRKRTGIGCLIETVKRVLIAEVFGLAKILESTRHAFEVLRALNPIHELLDFLSIFLFHLLLYSVKLPVPTPCFVLRSFGWRFVTDSPLYYERRAIAIENHIPMAADPTIMFRTTFAGIGSWDL